MTTFLNLPYEIFCKIVADLLGDINTLVNLALVSKSWNGEATKPLYSSSPHIPGRVTTSRRHLRAIRFLQVINTSQRHANMVRYFEWTIGESSGQKKFLEFFLKAVGRMKNLTSLYIRESSSKGSMKDVMPHLIHPDSKPSYQLKKLKWSCTRLPASIYQLCNFIAFHRHTLEDISLDFHDGHLPAFETHEDRRQLIGQFKAFREQDVYPPQTSFPHLPPSRVVLWPLARLHTLRGSQEALDTVLEVAAEPAQIQRLEIIASSEAEFLQPSHGSPNFDDILCRLVAYLKLNPLKIFNVDLVRNSTLKLENIIPHLSLIEKMTINVPSSLVHDVVPILNKFIRSPRPTLRFFAITMRCIPMDPSGREPDDLTDRFSDNRRVIRRLFSSCATLAQFRMEVFDADHSKEYSQYVQYSRKTAFSKDLSAGQTPQDSRKVQIKRESGRAFV